MNFSETDTVNCLQHSVKKPPQISWSRLQTSSLCIARRRFSLHTLQPGNFYQRANTIIHHSHGWPKAHNHCGTQSVKPTAAFSSLAPHTSHVVAMTVPIGNPADASHWHLIRSRSRCTQLIPSRDKRNCVTDNLCTLSIALTTKGTVTAIIFAKVQIVYFLTYNIVWSRQNDHNIN